MLNANNQPLAVPSAIGSNGSSLSVARTAARASTGTAGGLEDVQAVRPWARADHHQR